MTGARGELSRMDYLMACSGGLIMAVWFLGVTAYLFAIG